VATTAATVAAEATALVFHATAGLRAQPDRLTLDELSQFYNAGGYTELPWYWLGFDWFAFAFLMALFVPGLLALVVGYLAFRSRITGVYLSIITQALTHVKWNRPYVTRAVTLSPKTAMARDFHLSNGAKLLQENESTVNFEYTI
jgi:ABC-type branched-subunit amino acid transport system permease subunit